MRDRFFLLAMVVVGLISVAALGLTVTIVNPLHATVLQMVLFYGALFFVTAAIVTLAAFFVSRHIGDAAATSQMQALRHGATVGALIVAIVVLQAERLLSLPIIIALIAIVGVIELYVTSTLHHDHNRGQR